VVEALFLVILHTIADLSDRTQVLVLGAVVASCSVLGLGQVALGAHVDRVALRILRALAVRADRPDA
jgi:hypothetical protein